VLGQETGVMDCGGLDAEQSRPAASASLVVGDHRVGGEVVVHQAGLMRRRHDPVLDGHRPEGQWREQAVGHAATVAAAMAGRTVNLTATVVTLPPAASTVRNPYRFGSIRASEVPKPREGERGGENTTAPVNTLRRAPALARYAHAALMRVPVSVAEPSHC